MKNDLMARARVSGIFIAGIAVCVGLSVLCALTEQTAWLGVIAVLLAGAILGCLRKLQVDLHHTYKRLESWHALHAMVPLAAMPPAPRPWAASPELLRTVVELVTLSKPRLVLELGSGSSTIWIAAALAPSGAGQVVSLDHEEQFAQATQGSLAQHQLTNARVLHAPLVPTVVQGMAKDKTLVRHRGSGRRGRRLR